MPNLMAALPNIGGALCESSAIPFLVPCRNVWLMPTARVSCSNVVNIGECKTWWQNSVRGNSRQNVYIVYQTRRCPNIVQSLADLH